MSTKSPFYVGELLLSVLGVFFIIWVFWPETPPLYMTAEPLSVSCGYEKEIQAVLDKKKDDIVFLSLRPSGKMRILPTSRVYCSSVDSPALDGWQIRSVSASSTEGYLWIQFLRDPREKNYKTVDIQ